MKGSWRQQANGDVLALWTNVRYAWSSSVVVRASVVVGGIMLIASVATSGVSPGVAAVLVEVGAALALTLPIVLASRLIEEQTEGVVVGESRAARRIRAALGLRHRTAVANIEAFEKAGWRLANLSAGLRELADGAEEVFFVYAVNAEVVTVSWRGDFADGALVVGGQSIAGDSDRWVEAFVNLLESEYDIATGQLSSVDLLLRPIARGALSAASLVSEKQITPAVRGIVVWLDQFDTYASAVLLADGAARVADEETTVAQLYMNALVLKDGSPFARAGDAARVVRQACLIWRNQHPSK